MIGLFPRFNMIVGFSCMMVPINRKPNLICKQNTNSKPVSPVVRGNPFQLVDPSQTACPDTDPNKNNISYSVKLLRG